MHRSPFGDGLIIVSGKHSQRPASCPKFPCREESLGNSLGIDVMEELVRPFVDSGKRTEPAFFGCFLSNIRKGLDGGRSFLNSDHFVVF